MNNKYNKLSKDMEFNNYRVLCKFLEEDIKSGNGRIGQLKEWERHFNFTKSGNKIIILEVYDIPIKKNRQPHKYEQLYHIDRDKDHNSGIYCIIKDDNIYIGCTVKFRRRFGMHVYHGCNWTENKNYCNGSKFLIEEFAEMHLVFDSGDIIDTELLQMMESEVIQYIKETYLHMNIVNNTNAIYNRFKPKEVENIYNVSFITTPTIYKRIMKYIDKNAISK